MSKTEPSGNHSAGAGRRHYRRIRPRNTGAFTPSQTTRPMKRSRHWRRKILIFRILLVAFIVALAAAFYLIRRSPEPSVPFRESPWKKEFGTGRP